MENHSDYIVYVDESGDHGLESPDPSYPVFVLAFCVFKKSEYVDRVVPALQRLKFKHFGHDVYVLHEREIRKTLHPFTFLINSERRQEFMADLNRIIADSMFDLFVSLIDKQAMVDRDTVDDNVYHIAVRSCLERLFLFLDEKSHVDSTTFVVFEARGKKEDAELELEFRRVCDGENSLRRKLPFAPLFASKLANSCGLQLADLVARPIGRHHMESAQPNRAFDVLKEKFACSETGDPNGVGYLALP